MVFKEFSWLWGNSQSRNPGFQTFRISLLNLLRNVYGLEPAPKQGGIQDFLHLGGENKKSKGCRDLCYTPRLYRIAFLKEVI